MTFARYVLIQLFAYVIDMGGFLLMINAHWSGPFVANVIGKIFAGLFAFVAHRHFTFQGAQLGGSKAQAFKYFILLALNMPLSTGVLAALLMITDHPALAKVFADGICVLLTYWLSKTFIFAGPRFNPALPSRQHGSEI